jgi:hypothetical protein
MPDQTAQREKIMPLLNVIIILIVVGVLLWLVNNYIPMDSKIRSILNAVVIIVVILWLLQAFGILGSLGGVRVG